MIERIKDNLGVALGWLIGPTLLAVSGRVPKAWCRDPSDDRFFLFADFRRILVKFRCADRWVQALGCPQ